MSDHGLVTYILVSPEYKFLVWKQFSNNRAKRVASQGFSKYVVKTSARQELLQGGENLSYKMITFLAVRGGM